MTIATKPTSDRKEEEEAAKQPAFDAEANFAATYENPKFDSSQSYIPHPQWPLENAELYHVRRRRRMLTTLCVLLLLLWLLLATVMGGLLLYRYFLHRSLMHGWCGTDIRVDDDGFYQRLQQRVEVNPEYNYEKIEVPKFGQNRPAVFVHDFKQNLTAIVDMRGRQCFVKPLDSNVVPPKNFIDLLQKMEEGYYEQDTAVISERYAARFPPMAGKELDDLGSWMIEEQCNRFTTYMLEKLDGADLERPDADNDPVRLRRSACAGEMADFVEFVPQKSVNKISIQMRHC